MEENSEYQKLGSLNAYLNKDEVAQSDKILLIYHQILEELHEGCNRGQTIVEQEEGLERLKWGNEDISTNLSQIKDGLKKLERALTLQSLKNLELKKEADRICEVEKGVRAFELNQEEINKCVMKEDPEHLRNNLDSIKKKL